MSGVAVILGRDRVRTWCRQGGRKRRRILPIDDMERNGLAERLTVREEGDISGGHAAIRGGDDDGRQAGLPGRLIKNWKALGGKDVVVATGETTIATGTGMSLANSDVSPRASVAVADRSLTTQIGRGDEPEIRTAAIASRYGRGSDIGLTLVAT